VAGRKLIVIGPKEWEMFLPADCLLHNTVDRAENRFQQFLHHVANARTT
jgi:hypothetical protein